MLFAGRFMKKSSFIIVCLVFLIFIYIWLSFAVSPKGAFDSVENSLYKTAQWVETVENKYVM